MCCCVYVGQNQLRTTVLTYKHLPTALKKAGFQKELSESQSNTEIDDAQNESLRNFFHHLVGLQYIGSNDNNLLSEADIAKEIRGLRQAERNENDDESDAEHGDQIEAVPSANEAKNAVQVLHASSSFQIYPTPTRHLRI